MKMLYPKMDFPPNYRWRYYCREKKGIKVYTQKNLRGKRGQSNKISKDQKKKTKSAIQIRKKKGRKIL